MRSAIWARIRAGMAIRLPRRGLLLPPMGNSVTYEEANLTFLCKKLYQHQFAKENIAPEIQQYYASAPKAFPDFNGGWQPHIMFIGEIIDVDDKR